MAFPITSSDSGSADCLNYNVAPNPLGRLSANLSPEQKQLVGQSLLS